MPRIDVLSLRLFDSQWYDAVITIPGCDKNMPGSIMALARINRPGLMVYGGSIKPGSLDGEIIDIVSATICVFVSPQKSVRKSCEKCCAELIIPLSHPSPTRKSIPSAVSRCVGRAFAFSCPRSKNERSSSVCARVHACTRAASTVPLLFCRAARPVH